MKLFNRNLKQYSLNQLPERKAFLKFNFINISQLYQKYLGDLELYVRQMKRFLTVLLGILVIVITYVLHFVLFTDIPTVFFILMIIILIGHSTTIGILIYSSARITSFNKNFSLWFFNTIQHCNSQQLHCFKRIQNYKVKVENK